MLRLFVVSALALGSIFGVTTTAAPASATNYICAKVWTSGTVLGAHSAGTCQPYSGPTLCDGKDAGLDPSAHVYTLVCIPD